MTSQIDHGKVARSKSECGAALLSVLMTSTMLMAAGGALILATSMATRTAVDSTAEMQAYYSAEAGLQSVLNVLRGNVAPDSSVQCPPPTPTQISNPGQINFRCAVTTPNGSNLLTDTSGTPRLSGWLTYNYTPSGMTNPDRVVLFPTSGYAPATGLAYSVEVSDPDNTQIALEPTRLLLHVTGYGPKGAIKRLELILKRTDFDYVPPATIMMRGVSTGNANITVTTGDSAVKDYSGHDHSGSGVIPSFGATNAGDMNVEIDASNKNTVDTPIAAVFGNSSLPPWLQSPDLARSFLADLKADAIAQGRYFSTYSGYSGSDSSPIFTFVDGDCNLDGGAGLLVVTGNLEMNGNPSFSGLILVLGQGSVNRDGGGNGNIYGALAVARFDQNGSGPFLAPTFNTNGGGNSTMQFDSSAVRAALNIAGPIVQGVHEY
jgi:hypothetical protein